MIRIGEQQSLEVVKKVDFGIYLADTEDDLPEEGGIERVLLPAKQVPEGIRLGEHLSVFVYRDSSDRPIATTREPKLTLHRTAVLRVVETARIGAFLDWGLEKDLLLPFREQTRRVKKGEEVLVALYLDKSGRLCATMKVYHYLRTNSPYVIGDMVQGRVYETSGNFGVFVAVDDRFSALIPKKEAQGSYEPGQILQLRVTQVREDGKLTVTARQKAYLQMGDDAEMILEALREEGGILPFDDKADPEVIRERFGISKAAFKRAVGHLLKERLIRLEEGKICMM